MVRMAFAPRVGQGWMGPQAGGRRTPAAGGAVVRGAGCAAGETQQAGAGRFHR